jgi:hypothetical protein
MTASRRTHRHTMMEMHSPAPTMMAARSRQRSADLWSSSQPGSSDVRPVQHCERRPVQRCMPGGHTDGAANIKLWHCLEPGRRPTCQDGVGRRAAVSPAAAAAAVVVAEWRGLRPRGVRRRRGLGRRLHRAIGTLPSADAAGSSPPGCWPRCWLSRGYRGWGHIVTRMTPG